MKNTELIPTQQLLTFKLAVDQKNFAKAAKQLGISAVAVGKQIKLLEKKLNAPLLYRTTRHISLTDLGRDFYQYCERIITELQQATALAANYHNKIAGKLKIICSVYFGDNYILPHIDEFLTQYPQITLDLELADRIPNLETENIDVTFGLIAGLPSHMIHRRLRDDNYILCASPHYLHQQGTPKTIKDLAQHSYIAHSTRPKPDVLVFNHQEIRLIPKLYLNNTSAMLRCAIAGLGIVKLHSEVVKDAIKKKQLVEILKNYKEPKQPLYLYYKKTPFAQPKVRAFIDFILTKLT